MRRNGGHWKVLACDINNGNGWHGPSSEYRGDDTEFPVSGLDEGMASALSLLGDSGLFGQVFILDAQGVPKAALNKWQEREHIDCVSLLRPVFDMRWGWHEMWEQLGVDFDADVRADTTALIHAFEARRSLFVNKAYGFEGSWLRFHRERGGWQAEAMSDGGNRYCKLLVQSHRTNALPWGSQIDRLLITKAEHSDAFDEEYEGHGVTNGSQMRPVSDSLFLRLWNAMTFGAFTHPIPDNQ